MNKAQAQHLAEYVKEHGNESITTGQRIMLHRLTGEDTHRIRMTVKEADKRIKALLAEGTVKSKPASKPAKIQSRKAAKIKAERPVKSTVSKPVNKNTTKAVANLGKAVAVNKRQAVSEIKADTASRIEHMKHLTIKALTTVNKRILAELAESVGMKLVRK